MDPGTKLFVFVGGLGLLVGGVAWLWKRFIGVETTDAPEGWMGEKRPGEGDPGAEHRD